MVAKRFYKKKKPIPIQEYVEGIKAGDRTILAKAITLIESNNPAHLDTAQEVLKKLLPHSSKSLRIGITGVPGAGKSGIVRIYNKEKTIGDLFRYMKKIGEDIAVESLKTYLQNRKERNIPKLIEYAEICGVKKKIEPMVKAMLS